jgi:hypothetical protein
VTYSCSDFADSILESLDHHKLVNLDDMTEEDRDEFNDSPSDQADVCLEAIDRLVRERDLLRDALKAAAAPALALIDQELAK